MRRQIFFLLLFPLGLWAQQEGKGLAVTEAPTFCSAADAVSNRGNAAPAPATEATKTNVLPDAPGSLESLSGAVYETKPSQAPVPALKIVRVFNKRFIASHTAFLASIVYDAELTHQGLAHHKCVEANPYLGVHPSRGEIYEQNLLTFGAIGGLDWAAARFIKIPYIPYVTPLVETTVHLQGGSKWLTECW